MRACVRACMRVCVRACVHACVHVHVRVRVCVCAGGACRSSSAMAVYICSYDNFMHN